MRFAVILWLILCGQLCFAQKGSDHEKVVNSISFYRQNDSLDTREIRNIQDDNGTGFPYYVSLGSEDLKFIHYEFFRIDTTRYYVREYFNKGSMPGENVKSYGEEIIAKNIDTVIVDVFDFTGNKVRSVLSAQRHLIKEGKWREMESDAWPSIFREGVYLDNERVGLWKHLLPLDKDTLALRETDYEKNSIKTIYCDNGIREKSLTDLKGLLQGRWSGWPCADGGIIRSFKETVPGYIYSRHGIMRLDSSYYLFEKSGKFIKHLTRSCDATDKLVDNGTWRLRRSEDQTFIDIIYQNRVTWEMELLYYSEDDGLVINLNKHPNIQKVK